MVGAVTGIGILEGTGAFNWMLLVKFFAGGWLAALPALGARRDCSHACVRLDCSGSDDEGVEREA